MLPPCTGPVAGSGPQCQGALSTTWPGHRPGQGRWSSIHQPCSFLHLRPIRKDGLEIKGGLAQLARALAWHARGHRFDSGILHRRRSLGPPFLFPAVPHVQVLPVRPANSSHGMVTASAVVGRGAFVLPRGASVDDLPTCKSLLISRLHYSMGVVAQRSIFVPGQHEVAPVVGRISSWSFRLEAMVEQVGRSSLDHT